MIFSSLAPVLSAQAIRDPTGSPLETLGRYSTIPRALTARVFGAGNDYADTPVFWTTTKDTSLLNGRHSATVTLSPAEAPMHGGLCARTLLVLLSYLPYFRWKCRYARFTETVFGVRELATTPSNTLPLSERCPWNGQRGSLHPALGGFTSNPMFLTTNFLDLASLCPLV